MLPETWLTRAFRFGRALMVGSGATLVDFSIFTTCVRAIDVAPTHARLPALLAGACVQFVGNRRFTFRAQAGRLSRQLKLFVAAPGAGAAKEDFSFRVRSLDEEREAASAESRFERPEAGQ